MFNSLRSHELQHTRLPCSSPSPGVCSLIYIEPVMPSNHLILCCPLLLPSIFPSIRVFSSELDLYIWWPKYWASVSTSVFPTNIQGRFILELTGLIPLLSKGLSRIFSIQPHSFQALIFQFSAFFMVQLSHLYMTTGKIIALTIWTFGSKVMPLLFKHYLGLSFLLFQVFNFYSSKSLISRLQSPSEMMLEPKKRNSLTISIFSPSICHEVMGPDTMN